MDRHVDFWKNVLWSVETKPMDQRYIWCKSGKAYDQKNTITTIKHCGGPVLIWGCFAIAGSANIDCMKDINIIWSTGHFGKIVMPLVQRQKFDDQWTFLQDNHPKLYIQIYLKLGSGIGHRMFEWTVQSSDLNLIENIWCNLTKAVAI